MYLNQLVKTLPLLELLCLNLASHCEKPITDKKVFHMCHLVFGINCQISSKQQRVSTCTNTKLKRIFFAKWTLRKSIFVGINIYININNVFTAVFVVLVFAVFILIIITIIGTIIFIMIIVIITVIIIIIIIIVVIIIITINIQPRTGADVFLSLRLAIQGLLTFIKYKLII